MAKKRVKTKDVYSICTCCGTKRFVECVALEYPQRINVDSTLSEVKPINRTDCEECKMRLELVLSGLGTSTQMWILNVLSIQEARLAKIESTLNGIDRLLPYDCA